MTGAKSISALGVWRALLLFGVFGSVWLWHLSSVALSPPVDNIEQLVWMHSLEWGYYKHPPLPTWLVWVAVQMLGWSAWASYLLGASLTLASLAIFWHLLQAMRGAAYATVALLAAMCVTFYNGRLYYYYHNVALMLFIALSAWLCWRIVTRPNGWIWLALGIVGAMGLLSKYQMALAALCVVVVWARLGLWRQSGQRWGLVLALATTVLLFAPHAVWLLGHELGPIRYAEESSLGVSLGPWRRLGHTLLWLLDWAGNRCLPALIVLGVAWRAGRRGRGNIPPRQPGRGTRDPARTFLLTWGLLPALVMAVMGLTLGSRQFRR